MTAKIRVTVWNEFRHEKNKEEVRRIYPEGMHAVIAGALRRDGGFDVRTATLDEPDHGLGGGVLENTDVLIWWGHTAHQAVSDEIAAAVQKHVLEGMGLILLHSAHGSKPARRLLGTNCTVKWRVAGERERLWNLAPNHPIAAGIGDYFELPHEEMYGERFDIPAPDQLIFVSWFEGGEVFRSGCVFERGHGRIFYFRPGHETYPTLHDASVQRVIVNAARWLAPLRRIDSARSMCVREPLEKIGGAGLPAPCN